MQDAHCSHPVGAQERDLRGAGYLPTSPTERAFLSAPATAAEAVLIEAPAPQAQSIQGREQRPPRLVPAGQAAGPAGPVIETLVAAIGQGTISPKLAREMLVRLVPPAKATVRLPLPKIVDAASHAEACRRIAAAAAAGKIAPADAAALLKIVRMAWTAQRDADRERRAFRG